MKTIEIMKKLIAQPFDNLDEFTKELNRLCDIVENEQDNDKEMRQIADLKLNKLPHCTVISEQCRIIAENEALRKQLENSVQLPCKVGDTVYRVHVKEITVCDISMIQQKADKSWKIRLSEHRTGQHNPKWRYKSVFDITQKEFENTVFKTKPEAEARLKELEEQNDNN